MADPEDQSLLGASMRADDSARTWRSRISHSAGRRGVPLATIATTVMVAVAVVDLNLLVIMLAWVLRTIVLYTVVAGFIALILTPPARILQRRLKLSHGVAATVVFLTAALVFFGIIALFVTPLVSNASHFSNEIPNIIKRARLGKGPIGHLVYKLHLQKYLDNGAAKLKTVVEKYLSPATVLDAGTAAISTVTALLIIAILSLFALLEAPRIWAGFLSLFSAETAVRLQRVYEETSQSVTRYMLGRAFMGLLFGLVVFVTLSILGVPFALLLGIWVALTDLLPLVGGLLGGIPVVLIALFHSLPAGIVMLIVFLCYQQIENHLLNPVIMSRTVRMNPLWVLLSVLVAATLGERIGSGLGALVGAIMGIPIGGAIQVVVRELRRGPDAGGATGPPAGAGQEPAGEA